MGANLVTSHGLQQKVSTTLISFVLCCLGPHLEQVMEEMRKDLAENPPLAGSFTPKKGQMCVSRFSDGLWYVQFNL